MHRPCWHETSIVLVGLSMAPPNKWIEADERRMAIRSAARSLIRCVADL